MYTGHIVFLMILPCKVWRKVATYKRLDVTAGGRTYFSYCSSYVEFGLQRNVTKMAKDISYIKIMLSQEITFE